MRQPNNKRAGTKPKTKRAPVIARTKDNDKGHRPPAPRAGNAPRKSAPIKIDAVVTLLRRPQGASIAELCKATGWLPHSVRGALSGTVKKKLGLKVASTKIDGVRAYRITK